MSGTFFGLELGKRAIQANKLAMDVIGNNVASANTPGYTRQRVSMVSNIPYNVSESNGVFQIGTGVIVQDVLRDRDQFIDRQLRNNQSEISYWDKDAETLSRVEALFPDPVDGGIQLYINDFFNGWQSVNENPTDTGLRVGLLEKGRALTETMNQTYEQLGIISDNLDQSFTYNCDNVKQLAEQIADLNGLITKSYANNSNVLLDQRDLLLDDLSKLVKIDVKQNADNAKMVDVYVNGNPLPLIDGTTNNDIDLDTVAVGGTVGAIKYAKTQVVGYADTLQKLAGAIAKEVNAVYDDQVPEKDFVFFKDPPADGKIMELAVTQGSDIIVGLDDSANGDTRIALAIAQLRDKTITTNDLNTTFDTYYQGLLVTIGQQSKSAGQLRDNYQAIGDQFIAQRESVSGISIDEEMVDLMKYQTAYQASAKIVSTVNEMFDALFGMLR